YRTRHISDTHAYLDATATLMYSQQHITQVHQVKLSVPQKWKSYSGMVQLGPHEFVAQDWHQLADSPIETGLNELIEFESDGRSYQVVFWGKSNRENQKIADDLKKMVSESQTIWNGYPYQKYVFMIHATSGATGATEHVNSTVIQRPRESFAKRATYLDRFLRTAAHELVHTWNVKAYRPKGLVPYDYQQENYSDLLWVAEGSTSYLQDHILLTAKLQSVDEFLKELSERINDHLRKPGRHTQSIAEASFEKWISKGGDFANNHSVNIYSEGYMASLILDFKMLDDSKLKAGLKSLHNKLYQLNNSEKKPNRFSVSSYDSALMKQLMQELTGKSYVDWWQENIESPVDINFEELLDKVGLKFQKLQAKDYQVWTGLEFETKNSRLTINKVEKDSPAWKAGLTIGDQLIAINQQQVIPNNLELWLKKFKSGDDIELTFFRDQKLTSKSIQLAKISSKIRQIELVDNPTESQRAFFKAWLGVDFPDKKSETD
ncbi:MAG: PDZ domain-containing protein, partial [Kangiellaceae bacterium]|nr:PDZ domain-containing protein [Kangiellaceae bacterium]